MSDGRRATGDRPQGVPPGASRYRLLTAAWCLATIAPAPAFADKGMPQLDFANPLTISQIVWLVVVFAILYALLSAWALPKVGVVIESRAARVASDLDRASAAKEAADAAASEVREAAARSHAEAQSEINDAVTTARAAAADQAAAQKSDLDARMAGAETRLKEARRSAMANLPMIALATATTMVERLSGKPADAGAIHRAVDRLLPPLAA